jgi:hypothetical protein
MSPRRVLFVCSLLGAIFAALTSAWTGSQISAATPLDSPAAAASALLHDAGLPHVPQTASPPTLYVAERRPVLQQGQAKGQELSAWRAVPARAAGGREPVASSPYTNAWQLQATLTGAVIKDISFPTSQVGYVAAELARFGRPPMGALIGRAS